MIEIERKFLVKNLDFIAESFAQKKISQGYLSSNPERTVRIRIIDNLGFITIKGISNTSGLSRYEWEKEIPVNEAQELLLLCESGSIQKTRFLVNYENHIFEIDVFDGENKGLIIAEIELESENEFFKSPSWLGEEVTNDKKYYNSYISQNSFTTW